MKRIFYLRLFYIRLLLSSTLVPIELMRNKIRIAAKDIPLLYSNEKWLMLIRKIKNKKFFNIKIK